MVSDTHARTATSFVRFGRQWENVNPIEVRYPRRELGSVAECIELADSSSVSRSFFVQYSWFPTALSPVVTVCSIKRSDRLHDDTMMNIFWCLLKPNKHNNDEAIIHHRSAPQLYHSDELDSNLALPEFVLIIVVLVVTFFFNNLWFELTEIIDLGIIDLGITAAERVVIVFPMNAVFQCIVQFIFSWIRRILPLGNVL